MRRALLLCLALAACGRPLTEAELSFLSTLHGEALNMPAVRLHDGIQVGPPQEIPAPPRLTCQSRIYPPPRGGTIRVNTGAVAMWEDVYVRGDLYREDFAAGWPETIVLEDAMLLAHEMVHAWQWQNRSETGYHPLRAAFEHVRSRDPYLFDLETDTDYLDYGYEQQGAIMEEYVCCRTLDPEAPRTQRLHEMLAEHLPLAPIEEARPQSVWLPWDGVEVEGICGA